MRVHRRFHTTRQRIRSAQRLKFILRSFVSFVSLCETFPIPAFPCNKIEIEIMRTLSLAHLYTLNFFYDENSRVLPSYNDCINRHVNGKCANGK